MSNCLFQPGRINGLELKNRVIMAPMGARGLIEPDGRFSHRAVDYYRARAEGGVGMIITGLMAVETEIEKRAPAPWSPLARADSTLYIARLNELAEAVHDHGAKIAAQLTAGYGRVAKKEVVQSGWAVAPSKQPCFSDPCVMARELGTGEIERLIEAFGKAAVTVRMAGFDAIELHGHEGYLMDQFMTAKWNRRTDRYGGDAEGRLRFPLEIIQAIRQAVGADFPLIFRMAANHYVAGGRKIDASVAMAQRFEAAGVNCLHVDAGCYESKFWAHPPCYMDRGCTVDGAAAVKKAVGIPVIAVGRLGYPDLAESVIAEGRADFVALGRALLADPQWPNKAKTRRFHEIRPCIGDFEGCLGRIIQGKTIGCSVNPQTGREKELALSPAVKKKSVLVIGGGPGGMEAARVAALRGHRVTLWEKEGQLGGNLVPAAVPEFKSDIKILIAYLTGQVEQCGIQVALNKTATPELVISENPDAVIAATGASPVLPEIPGADRQKIATVVDLLLGKKVAGRRVVVLGGGTMGCETALWLARQGKRVLILEPLGDLMTDAFSASRELMLQLLAEAGVEILSGTRVVEITATSVVAETGDARREVAAESVVAAAGMKSNTDLIEGLTDTRLAVHAIGDCVVPRNVMGAIWQGFRVAARI
jgi:2-enoate reductase